MAFLTMAVSYAMGSAQVDSVRFSNGDLLVGKIKSMDKGVLKIETDYSDSDFLIEWKKVTWINSQTNFAIIMRDGEKFYSAVLSLNDSISRVITESNNYKTVTTKDIVYMNAYDERFKDRFKASIDIGTELARAQNVKSFTTRSNIGYKTENWSTDISFNTLVKSQDSTETIRRTDGSSSYRQFISGTWYAIVTVSFLSNTEQKLDLRSNAQLGLGLFFIRTNSAYWGGKIGGNRNIERYSNETEDRDSWEAYIGTELDLYDIGDFSFKLDVTAYPGITARDRFRLDGGLDLKYDLPFDFYIKLGTSINYDNKPAIGASEFDYVIQAGVGWEW